MFKYLISKFAVVIFFSQTIFAQTTGKISGKILDAEQNSPLIGVNIIIHQTQKGTSSDQDGYFNIINVSPGKYTVKIMMIGYCLLYTSPSPRDRG